MNHESGYKLRNGIFTPLNIGSRRKVSASFDSAQNGPQMSKRFAYADDASPNTDNNSSTRREIRNRARYEAQNSSYARGITLTVANDTIGTGPRLQYKSDSTELNAEIEADWKAWSASIDLAAKLRSLRMARMIDGEVLAEMYTNNGLSQDVKLDLTLYEADYLQGPWGKPNSKQYYDGIEYDPYGNPRTYYITEEHPGDQSTLGVTPIPHRAENIIHYFRVDRPGQRRGVSEIQSALELFNMLRTYAKAVLDCAESAANHMGVMHTTAPADERPDDVNAFYEEPLTRNMMKALPYGWDFRQLKAEQPVDTYNEFVKAILNEIARCLNVPFNIAALNSSEYNYASGRLDHQTYFKCIDVERAQIESEILERIFRVWVMEWGTLRRLPNAVTNKYSWFWDGRLHVDPLKEAEAQALRLANLTTTYADEYGREGKDWESSFIQRAAEKAKMKELNLSAEEVAPSNNKEANDE